MIESLLGTRQQAKSQMSISKQDSVHPPMFLWADLVGKVEKERGNFGTLMGRSSPASCLKSLEHGVYAKH